MCIATKYALLHKSQQEELRTQLYKGEDVRVNDNVLSAWGTLSGRLIDIEIERSFERWAKSKESTKFLFMVDNRWEVDKCEIMKCAKKEKSYLGRPVRVGLVSDALGVAMRALSQGKYVATSKFTPIICVCAIINGLFPIVLWIAKNDESAYKVTPDLGLLIPYQFCVVSITFFFSNAMFSFSVACGLDFYRRYVLMAYAGLFIDVKPDKWLYKQLPPFSAPFVSLTVPSNIVAWESMCQILSDVGITFKYRLEFYMSYCMGAVFCLCVFVLVLIGAKPVGMTTIDLLIPLISAAWNVSVILIVCLVVIYYGIKANRQNLIQQQTLNKCELKIQELVSEQLLIIEIMKQEESENYNHRHKHFVENLRSCARLISCVQKSISLENKIRPYTVLGMEATPLLMKSVGAFLGSVAVTVYAVLQQSTLFSN